MYEKRIVPLIFPRETPFAEIPPLFRDWLILFNSEKSLLFQVHRREGRFKKHFCISLLFPLITSLLKKSREVEGSGKTSFSQH